MFDFRYFLLLAVDVIFQEIAQVNILVLLLSRFEKTFVLALLREWHLEIVTLFLTRFEYGIFPRRVYFLISPEFKRLV